MCRAPDRARQRRGYVTLCARDLAFSMAIGVHAALEKTATYNQLSLWLALCCISVYLTSIKMHSRQLSEEPPSMPGPIEFQTEPSRYRHWKLKFEGEVAELIMDVDESATLFEGYQLKLNSYDLGVDIELADAVQRLRFEHPEVKVVV